MMRIAVTCCLMVSVCATGARAAAPTPQSGLDAAMLAKMAAAGKAPGAKPDKGRFPDFKKVTKDMVAKKGLFTLWSYPPRAKDKDPEKLLCQIPSGFLGEKFMLSVSFSGGGFFTGFPLEERVVKWEVLDKKLLLIEPDTGYVVNAKNTVSDVVRRTYPERIRVALPIVTKTPGGDPVFDMGTMLKSNFANIAWMSFGPFGGASRGGGINAGLSQWTTKKTFKLNVEIGVALAMRSGSPPGSYDKKMVHFSFWKLPKSDYKPRIADDRVGYFLTANQDWAKPTSARDIFNRYIDRWHLVKRDPSLKKCEPRKPIVFYIEKTVPVRFRRAVRDGILEWNKAYEKVGFINAVEVRQQTKDNEWKDLDPEDMRYSFFRWIVTGAGFAMGPHRANPFTGQVYDADIIFDDAMVRFYEKSAGINLPSALVAERNADPVMREFFEHNPQWKRPTRPWESVTIGGDANEGELRNAMRRRLRDRGHLGCDYYEGMKQQMALAHSMLAGQSAEVIDRFLYDVIKEVVMHEVGHTLGLRHNFKASTIYSIDEIKRRRETGEPTVGSVMDYNPILFFADKALDGHFITPTIGPYDYWAIEYGYRPADGSYKGPQKAEKENGKSADEPKEEKVAATNGNDSPSHGIPEDVLARLPEDVRKMIAAKAAEGGHASPKANGGKKKKPSAPSFTGPNAAERKMLDAIASRAAEPELAYATDEDTTFLSPDPRSNRFDMAGDPIEWAESRIAMIDQRLSTLLEWAVKDRESWYHTRAAFGTLLGEKARVLRFVGRYIGGVYTSRSHRGDADAPPPLAVVDGKRQRNALAFIEKNVFQDEFFTFPPELLNHLTVPRWSHRGARVSYVVDYPIHDVIAAVQWSILFDRLFPYTLRRIYDGEMKTDDADRLTAAEYLQRVQSACWPDSMSASSAKRGNWSDASPFMSSIRRSLQREYLNLMEPLVRTPPGWLITPDLHAMVKNSLRKLSGQLDELKGVKLDFASESHLIACKSRIDRMLEPELREY